AHLARDGLRYSLPVRVGHRIPPAVSAHLARHRTDRCLRGLNSMATWEFKLPDIGEGVVEGEIVKWLVKAGDDIGEDQPMVEVMTDKATVTIPSPKKGRVLKTFGKEGEIAKVHHPLVMLELDGGAAAAKPEKVEKAEPSHGAP